MVTAFFFLLPFCPQWLINTSFLQLSSQPQSKCNYCEMLAAFYWTFPFTASFSAHWKHERFIYLFIYFLPEATWRWLFKECLQRILTSRLPLLCNCIWCPECCGILYCEESSSIIVCVCVYSFIPKIAASVTYLSVSHTYWSGAFSFSPSHGLSLIFVLGPFVCQ